MYFLEKFLKMNINDLPEDVLAFILRLAVDKKVDNVLYIEPVCYQWLSLVDKYCLWREIAGNSL